MAVRKGAVSCWQALQRFSRSFWRWLKTNGSRCWKKISAYFSKPKRSVFYYQCASVLVLASWLFLLLCHLVHALFLLVGIFQFLLSIGLILGALVYVSCWYNSCDGDGYSPYAVGGVIMALIPLLMLLFFPQLYSVIPYLIKGFFLIASILFFCGRGFSLQDFLPWTGNDGMSLETWKRCLCYGLMALFHIAANFFMLILFSAMLVMHLSFGMLIAASLLYGTLYGVCRLLAGFLLKHGIEASDAHPSIQAELDSSTPQSSQWLHRISQYMDKATLLYMLPGGNDDKATQRQYNLRENAFQSGVR